METVQTKRAIQFVAGLESSGVRPLLQVSSRGPESAAREFQLQLLYDSLHWDINTAGTKKMSLGSPHTFTQPIEVEVVKVVRIK